MRVFGNRQKQIYDKIINIIETIIAWVAEWQTRHVEVVVGESPCGFDSHLGHQIRREWMIIIDQAIVEDEFEGDTIVTEVHEKMIAEHFMFEIIDELSAMGLTVLRSAGFEKECKVLEDSVNADLVEYDFRINDTKYKLINISFI